jgi:hypothetical protein
MRRPFIAILAALAIAVAFAAPVGAKTFGHIYANGETYRTFVVPAPVAPGTGRDPLYAFGNSPLANQYSVARFAPGRGSHGGLWQVWVVTWKDPSQARLLTSYADIQTALGAGEITIVRNEAGDVRCPLLPNG